MTERQLKNGAPCRWFAELDSTNEEAKRLATRGERGPLWIGAEAQTGGHGRRGREWISPKGNLYCTLLIAPRCTPMEGGQLSFVTALAASDTILNLSRKAPVQFKWPNDILLDGAKCGGILLESAGAENLEWIAAGIGLNLVSHPEETEFPATSLAAHGIAAPAPFACLELLAFAFDDWFTRWKIEGFAPVRRKWLARARGINESIAVRLGRETLTGIFRDLDVSGALVLELAGGGRRKIPAGEVFF